MDSDWLPDEQIRGFLANPILLRKYVAESPLRASNATNDFLVLVREHDAWRIDGGGWNDANAPPTHDGTLRQVLNYYDETTCSKLYVPQSSLIQSVIWDKDAFILNCRDRAIRATVRQVWLAVQDSMTGRALTEGEIKFNFGKLDGSSPLKYHTA